MVKTHDQQYDHYKLFPFSQIVLKLYHDKHLSFKSLTIYYKPNRKIMEKMKKNVRNFERNVN